MPRKKHNMDVHLDFQSGIQNFGMEGDQINL
jgi:hypothetical protein